MSKHLAGAAALALATLAGQAFAQDTDNIRLQTTVPAFCQASIFPSGTALNLGSLINSQGFVVTSFVGTSSVETAANYYCNAPSEVTLSATPLTATPAVPVDSSGAFSNQVNYVASLTWDNVTGTTASTATAPAVIPAIEANIGKMILALGTPTTPNGARPVAANYAGSVTITVGLK